MTTPTFQIVTPATGALAALAAIHVSAPDEPAADHIITRLNLAPLPTGALALRTLGPPDAPIDTGVAARPDPTTILITPHASPLILRSLARWLEANQIGATTGSLPPGAAGGRGGLPAPVPPNAPGGEGNSPAPDEKPPPPRSLYPEARTPLEAALLHTLAHAPSPLAIDTLLRQPELWNVPDPQPDPAHDRVLNRLLTPPLVVAVGHTNIGKSTLVNALARRTVSITADLPGTTRDHVGVTLDLAGLVVRWIDTPGLPRDPHPTDPIESDAIALARDTIAAADLILSCADATAPFLDPATLPAPPDTRCLTCALRADLAPPPPADVTTSATRPDTLAALTTAIRDTLLPPASLTSQTPWRFHPALPG